MSPGAYYGKCGGHTSINHYALPQEPLKYRGSATSLRWVGHMTLLRPSNTIQHLMPSHPRRAARTPKPVFPRASGGNPTMEEPSGGRLGGTVLREVLSRSERTKLDVGDDTEFYGSPRLVTHVDNGFLRQLTALYAKRIPPGGAVLDLMSSHVSHLPRDVKYSNVVGHGMNAVELSRNSRLDSWFLRDLNKEPGGWPLPDRSFDAVLICVSVQYLQQPEAVFSEIYRVLKPGGVVIVSFSNRQFYSKAVQAWRDGSGYSRTLLVKSYFLAVAGFTEPEAVTEVGGGKKETGGGISSIVAGFQKLLEAGQKDPFYAVIAYRNFRPVHD